MATVVCVIGTVVFAVLAVASVFGTSSKPAAEKTPLDYKVEGVVESVGFLLFVALLAGNIWLAIRVNQ